MASSSAANSPVVELVEDGRARAVTLEDRVQVRDRRGRLVFEFLDAENRAVLHVPEGDLELRADQGEIVLFGAQGVALESDQDVKLTGRNVDLEGDQLSIKAEKGLVGIGELLYEGRRFAGRIVNATTVVDRFEMQADRITTGCREMYQNVEGLLSTRVTSWRGVVQQLFSLHADSANIRTDEDLTLDGKEIRLG